MPDAEVYIYRLGFLKKELHKWIDNWPNHVIINYPRVHSVPNGYGDCVCDRMGVCPYLGCCFFDHDIVKGMPKYMSSQIKNAKSMKKALLILKHKKYIKNEETQIAR